MSILKPKIIGKDSEKFPKKQNTENQKETKYQNIS